MSETRKKDSTPLVVSELHEVQQLPDESVRADTGSFVVLEGRLVSGSTQREITHVCVSGVRVPSPRARRYDTTD